jgi:tetratricopeptide (TPR) repeat protein
MRRWARVALIWGAVAAAVTGGCSWPPWRFGAPLDGRPSIPPLPAIPSPREARAAVVAARAAGQPVLEIRALEVLEHSYRLDAVLRARPTPAELARLTELLEARAAAFRALGRAVPESRDLEAVARLDPARGQGLIQLRAAAAARAGDFWKSVHAADDARAAFALAAALGGVAAGTGGAAATPEPLPSPLPQDLASWVLQSPALSTRVLPLAVAAPWVLDDQPRALSWAELLLDEDPSSPDVLALVALIFGHAGRFGGTERMLTELTFYTPDRASGLARGAQIWEQVGRTREACAQWIRAARWRDEPEDPLWLKAIACAHRDPGAGDWREIRAYVLDRTPAADRDDAAARLDAAAGDGG